MDELLSGSLGVLPLAPIAAVEPKDVPEVIRRLGERFGETAPPEMVGDLWAATEVMLGLRYDRDEA